MSIVYFTADDRKPMKQRIPESWLTQRKTVRQLVLNVAKAVLGHEPDYERLQLLNADTLQSVDLAGAICDAMTDGTTFVISETAVDGAQVDSVKLSTQQAKSAPRPMPALPPRNGEGNLLGVKGES